MNSVLENDISCYTNLVKSSIRRELEQKKQLILGTNIIMKEFVFGCNHDWVKHNSGYICQKCKFYTGCNRALNDNIEKLENLKLLLKITKK